MKKIFLILLVIFNLQAIAQEVSYSSGTEFINKNGTFKSVIGEDKNSFYVLRLGTKGSGVQNNIEKYDRKTFQLEWVKDISFEKDLGGNIPSGDAFQQSYVVLSRGKIYFFLSLLETRNNTRSVYSKTMETAKGNILGKAELLAQESEFKDVEKLEISFSNDTTLALIKFPFRPKKRIGLTNNFASTTFACINKVKLFDLKTNKEIFTKEFPLTDSNGKLGITSAQTDNNGNLVCIYTHVTSQFEGEKPGIAKVPVNSTELTSFDLNLGVNDHAYLISNVLQYDDNFDVAIITGVFIDVSCKGKDCRKEGLYYLKVDLNKSKVISAKHTYFDETMHKEYKDLFDPYSDYNRLYCVTSILDKATGDVYMISSGMREALFVNRFDKNGEVLWTKIVPRYDTKKYAYAFKKGSLHIIYLEHPKGMEVEANSATVKSVKSFSAATGMNVVCMSFSKDGQAKKTVLFTNERDTANFIPETIDDLSERSPVYSLKNRDKEKFIRFEFH
jgi:hypothetical protein